MIKKILLFGIIFLLFFRCANIVSPEGGARDTRPPQLDSTKISTKNFSTNFEDKEIVLHFDEWVKLDDVFNQVIVSPPLESNPDIQLKGKKVIVNLKNEALKSNTTYTINFGESIKDFTEGNTLSNYRFVFSTGDYIDSLSIRGSVKDAFTQKAEEKVLVMLYDNLEDSVVHKERPLYFARTDEAGNFSIENIKGGAFKVFALVDNNYNYLFDLPNEKIGFPDENILVTDSTNINLKINIFEEQQELRIKSSAYRQYGKLKLEFNQKVDSLDFSILPPPGILKKEYRKDSLLIWYDLESGDSLTFYSELDTFGFKLSERTRFIENSKLFRANQAPKAGKSRNKFNKVKKTALPPHNPGLPFLVEWNFPIKNIDKTKIRLLEDTLKNEVSADFLILADTPRTIQMQFPLKEGKPYELIFLPGAVTDIYGLQNDTTKVEFKTLLYKQLGNIIFNLSGLDKETGYILELMTSTKKVKEDWISGKEKYTKEYKYMPSSSYYFRVIEDKNKNKIWDSGKYINKSKPEKIYSNPKDQLRPNWDLEIDMDISKQLFPPVDTTGKNDK